jgi:hypothetical protein
VTIQTRGRAAAGAIPAATSFNVTRLSNGDVILYNTVEYQLILVKNENERLLPRRFEDLWTAALGLVKDKPPKAVLFKEKNLLEIAEKLAGIILLAGQVWPLPPPRKATKSKARA